MLHEDRKRKLKNARDENDYVECDAPLKKKLRNIDLHSEDNGEDLHHQSLTTVFKGVFSWIVDVTTKNYFVESAMSALNIGSPRNGRYKPKFKSKHQIQKNEVDVEDNSSHPFRYDDLKRSPLRESVKKRSSLQTPLNHREMNFGANKVNKRSSNVLLERKKVVEHPFKAMEKVRRADFPVGEKAESNRNIHLGSSLLYHPSAKQLSVVNSENTAQSAMNSSNFVENSSPNVKAIGNLLYKKQGHTSEDVMALQEREQYKMLLECFTKYSVKQEKTAPTVEHKEVQTSIYGQLPSMSPMQQAFKKKTLDSGATNFLAKYLKGHPYGMSGTSKPPSTVKSLSVTPRKPENEDAVIIAEVKLPPPRPLHTSPTSSHIFSPEWINDLKKSFNEETERKVKIVQDQEEKIKKFRESRAARLAAEEKALEKLRISGTVAKTEEVEDTSRDFPELTPKMEEIIDEALNPEPPEEVLCVGFNISVSRKDIETLSGLNWLNDEIIYFYMNLLMERSKNDNYPSVYAFNTFFYPKLMSGGHSVLKRWTRKVDIFAHELILVPVHMGMHWCLAVIDFRHKKIRYYDSMGGQNTDCLHALRDYLKDERMDKKKEVYEMSGWSCENVKNIPHQMNGSDCGMFTLKYAEYITRDSKITFTQDHMQYFRRRMVYEILAKQLL